MNGSAHGSARFLDITLKRGPAGLGFNILGGVDQQYLMNDSGIYVAKIKEYGAAAQDGRLKEGDKILAINGEKLDALSHSAAVQLFRTAGENVHLSIQQLSSQHHNGPVSSGTDGDSSSSVSWTLFTLAVATAAIAASVIAYKRFNPRLPRGSF